MCMSVSQKSTCSAREKKKDEQPKVRKKLNEKKNDGRYHDVVVVIAVYPKKNYFPKNFYHLN